MVEQLDLVEKAVFCGEDLNIFCSRKMKISFKILLAFVTPLMTKNPALEQNLYTNDTMLYHFLFAFLILVAFYEHHFP